MTAKDFMLRMQEYYGSTYSRVMAEEVLSYIQHRSDKDIQEIYDRVLMMHSAKYRALPDVAVICDALDAESEEYKERCRLAERMPKYPEHLLLPQERTYDRLDEVDRPEEIRGILEALTEKATETKKTKKYPD